VIYVDTSVLVALVVNEASSAAVAQWYAASKAPLVSAAWCVPEFASALGIKQRTGHLTAEQAQEVWATFSRLVDSDVQLLPVEPADFHRAALMTMEPTHSLRAGDALHLACAERANARTVATLDVVMVANAKHLGLRAVVFGAG
jgi:uncharacterized protein